MQAVLADAQLCEGVVCSCRGDVQQPEGRVDACDVVAFCLAGEASPGQHVLDVSTCQMLPWACAWCARRAPWIQARPHCNAGMHVIECS